MMKVVLRWDVTKGKMDEAIDWAKRNASFRRKQPGVEDVTVMVPLHGPIARFHIVTTHSSVTAWDEFKKKVDNDPEFDAIRKEPIDKGYFAGPPERFLYETV